MTSRTGLVFHFFAGTGSTYSRIVHMCTFGFDHWWKSRMLNRLPRHPDRILEQACGTGLLTLRIARRYPACRIIGVDVQDEYLRIAGSRAAARGAGNVEFHCGRAEDVVLAEPVDAIVSSYLAKYADLDRLIANAAKMLKSGGVIVMHDFVYPQSPRFARLWEFYFNLLQTFGSRMFPAWKTIFYELPVLLKKSTWANDLKSALEMHGFSDIRVEYLTHGTAAILTASKYSRPC